MTPARKRWRRQEACGGRRTSTARPPAPRPRSRPLSVGAAKDLAAGGSGIAVADAEGTASSSVVDVGQSQAMTTWSPTALAYVGNGTTLSSGGDVVVQAAQVPRAPNDQAQFDS